jgi:hypothetical protein
VAVERLREVARRSRRFVLDTLREGIDDGSIRGDIDPDLLIVPVLATIHAVIGSTRNVRSRAGDKRPDPERVLFALVRLLEPFTDNEGKPTKKGTER